MEPSYQQFKNLAKDYACGNINISNIIHFKRYSYDEPSSYETYKGAFIYPISGTANIHFGDNVYLAKPGTLIHGCPGQRLSFNVLDDIPFEHINLYYDCFHNIQLDMKLDNYQQIIPLLIEATQIPRKNTLRAIFRKEQLMDQILDLTFQGAIGKKVRTNQHLITEIEDYIHNNFEKKITLKSLSDYAGKTPQQLSYLFHQYTGMRPIDYLIRCRIEHALLLLKEDAYSIQEISNMVGYSDPLYFSRLFKKHIGYPPSKIKTI